MLYNGNNAVVVTNTAKLATFLDSHVFVLGANDPEMDRIERVLIELNAHYLFANINDTRCNPSNAYKMDKLDVGNLIPVFIECGGSNEFMAQFVPFVKIDHHNEGDFGFDKGPEQYWEASSLGQLHRLLLAQGASPCVLDMVFGEDKFYVAASDHSPSYAYKGMCPGIDPGYLQKLRAIRQADFLKMGLKEYLEKLDESIEKTYHLPVMELEGEAYLVASNEIFMLNEVSLIIGQAVQYYMGPTPREARSKLGLLGGSPSLTKAWMELHSEVLDGVYGSPERGYAGGYLKTE